MKGTRSLDIKKIIICIVAIILLIAIIGLIGILLQYQKLVKKMMK